MRTGRVMRIVVALSIGLAGAGAEAADLNQRNRLDDGKLGMPLDRMFKAKPNRSPYEPEGAGGERGFLPPMIPLTPPPPSRSSADEGRPAEVAPTKRPGAKPGP